jgi:excisionase family DNA binding protein
MSTTQAEIFTLEEVASYLRLPPETIARQAAQRCLPGRQIEDTWRFLRAAIDDWLRSHDSRTILLQQVGAFADDDSPEERRENIYATRGRAEAENDEIR